MLIFSFLQKYIVQLKLQVLISSIISDWVRFNIDPLDLCPNDDHIYSMAVCTIITLDCLGFFSKNKFQNFTCRIHR